jgi:hypothetical protein
MCVNKYSKTITGTEKDPAKRATLYAGPKQNMPHLDVSPRAFRFRAGEMKLNSNSIFERTQADPSKSNKFRNG